MLVAFRADASPSIGTGHLMRCLALADALKARGHDCHFLCRPAGDTLFALIDQRGHRVHRLSAAGGGAAPPDAAADAAATLEILAGVHPEWLVVDHYRLDKEWECAVASASPRLLAIDDLGRPHSCDVLLDQNFGSPAHARYHALLDKPAKLLLGPQFALLRPQFASRRAAALARRDGTLRRVLVSMGGTDPDNETSKVLEGLKMSRSAHLPTDVVMGAASPHLPAVEEHCRGLPLGKLHVQTSAMAELMLGADCAFTAGGSTTWERCCLGLPALVTVVSEDQAPIARAVAAVGAHSLMGWNHEVTADRYASAIDSLSPQALREMSVAAAQLCDGRGTERVVDCLQ